MINLKPDDEIIGMWLVGNGLMDFMGIVKIESGKLVGQYRFRYYRSEDAWDGQDEKHWYKIGPLEDSLEERARVKGLMLKVIEGGVNLFGMTQAETFSGGTGEELIEWMQKSEFFHMKEASKEEAEELKKEEIRH